MDLTEKNFLYPEIITDYRYIVMNLLPSCNKLTIMDIFVKNVIILEDLKNIK
jgi:hypothetical protein